MVINNPQNGAYYGGAVIRVFSESQIMGDVLRLENEAGGMPADSDHLLVMHSGHVAVSGSGIFRGAISRSLRL